MKRSVRFTRVRFVSSSVALAALLLPVVAGSRALAQGGYPGSGYPPAPLGWKALPRPGTSGSEPSDFDHTGQTFDTRSTFYDNGPSSTSPVQLYGSYTYPNTEASVGGASELIAWSRTVSGDSTYLWQWLAPYKPGTTIRDLDNFPVPPLFVLGSVTPFTKVDADADPNRRRGLNGTLTLSDGWGWSGTDGPHAPPLVVAQFNQFPHRKVLPATVEAPDKAKVTLSPGVSVSVTGSRSGDSAWIVPFIVAKNTYPIFLHSPNPFGLPFDGDGTNQFAYDDSYVGELALPAIIQVARAATVDTQWLVDQNRVGWTVRPMIQGSVGYGKSASGEFIYAEANSSRFDSSGSMVFQGLPASNANFGLHNVFLKVDGADSQKAYVQTFYASDAKNHPNENTTGFWLEPNWYYYYKQVHPASGPYAPGEPSNTASNWPYDIDLRDDASPARGTYPVRVFTVGASGHIKLLGTLTVSGIHRYIYVSEHEQGHRNNNLDDIQRTGSTTNWPSKSDPSAQDPSLYRGEDWDDDGLNNGYELDHHLDPQDSDTADAYLSNGSPHPGGDSECAADIQALGRLLPTEDKWRQDWATNGLQWGERRSKMFFPWTFTNDSSGTTSKNPPSHPTALTSMP